MSKLFGIKGNKFRGNEVINSLKSLGAINLSNLSGTQEDVYYIIGNDNIIHFLPIEILNDGKYVLFESVDEFNKALSLIAELGLKRDMDTSYPSTFKECYQILNTSHCVYRSQEFDTYNKLILCRDAYWKIAGTPFGLDNYVAQILKVKGKIVTPPYKKSIDTPFFFPTEEMRDAFYQNYKDDLEFCKNVW
jgi:hypothetical protein